MPVFDDDLDDAPPAAPAPRAAGPAKKHGRQNPLIPKASLRGWEPDPAAVKAAIGRWVPTTTQGGVHDAGTQSGNR